VIQPLFGALADRIGRRNAMIAFGTLMVLTTVPLLNAIGHVGARSSAFALILLALAFVSFYTSISGLVKAELFPMEVRALGVGLSYAIANAIFGGTAEYVALWFKQAGHEPYFYWYVTLICAIALIAAISMPDTRRHGMLQDHEGALTPAPR
jgi:MHS family alpha-ketoglutarate permease-like MFS transporter